MDEPLAAPGIRFRDFRWEDIPALVDIRTRTSPENPGSQERMEYFERTYPADNPRLRYVVENAAGKCIGQGSCEHSLLSFRIMKEHGCTQTVTQNDTANPPILRLNEKLGYQKKPAMLQWEKKL